MRAWRQNRREPVRVHAEADLFPAPRLGPHRGFGLFWPAGKRNSQNMGTMKNAITALGLLACCSAAAEMRRVAAGPDYLAGKKPAIWCFGAREFTESSGWDLVPLQ